jgi:hypothetical protein
MSHASMREHIKAKVEHADLATLQSIWEIFDQSERRSTAVPEPTVSSAQSRADKTAIQSRLLQFVGENLTLEEFEHLSLKERAMLQRRLKKQNYDWLQKKFSELGAAWLVVVDSKVITSGKSLKTEPMPPQLVKISRRTGKFPFVFVNDDFLAIEESGSAWHSTTDPGDYYPTLPIILGARSDVVEVVGDFDTGANPSFVDYDFLLAQNLIMPVVGEFPKTSHHLNRSYEYVAKFLRFRLSSKEDETRVLETKICCVLDWHTSPFVKINPNRVALIGRDIMLELKPRVLLDFEKCQTEIGASIKSEPTRKKSPLRKKRTPRRR